MIDHLVPIDRKHISKINVRVGLAGKFHRFFYITCFYNMVVYISFESVWPDKNMYNQIFRLYCAAICELI